MMRKYMLCPILRQPDGQTVGCMNMSELLKNSRKARSIYVLVALGLIAVALVISSEIARNITFPIQKLRDSMKESARREIFLQRKLRCIRTMRSEA